MSEINQGCHKCDKLFEHGIYLSPTKTFLCEMCSIVYMNTEKEIIKKFQEAWIKIKN